MSYRSRLFAAMSLAVLVTSGLALAADLPLGGTFVDDDGNVYEGHIEAITAEGITQGCNPPVYDLYCPTDVVTRGQMAGFLHRALDRVLTPGAAVEFVDDDGSVFEPDIEWLAATGVTRGCNPPINDRFCPEAPVTRGQMAAFLVRAFGYVDDGGGDLFGDDDGSIFEGDIDRLGAAGLANGCNPPVNDRFCPEAPVTRGQMAFFLAGALGLEAIVPPPRQTTTTSTTTSTTSTTSSAALTIHGRSFYQDGEVVHEGSAAEGLLVNARLVQAIADFRDQLPGWDPEANTDAFISALDSYAAHGLNGITVNFQGGLADRSWGEGYNNSAWTATGELKPSYASRMTRALDAMTARGIVPIVGVFYFRQDQILENEAAVVSAVDNAIAFLEPWKDSIIIEVVNEANHGLVSHPLLEPNRVGEMVLRFRNAGYLATFSQVANTIPSVTDGQHNSVILLHGNDKTVEDIRDMVARARNRFPDRPVMFNEDGPTGRPYTDDEFISHLDAAIVDSEAGWGLYDQEGFQTPQVPTINWLLDTPRKQLIFDRFAAHTDAK